VPAYPDCPGERPLNGCSTTSNSSCYRCLGEKTSSIEMDAIEITSNQMSDLEAAINERIRAACKMFPTLYESKDDPQLLDVSNHHTHAVVVVIYQML